MFTLSTTNFLGTTSFAYGSLVSSGQSIGNPLTWMKVNHQHPDSIIGVVADVLVFLLQDMILVSMDRNAHFNDSGQRELQLHRLYIVYTLNKYRRSLFVTFLIGILYLMGVSPTVWSQLPFRLITRFAVHVTLLVVQEIWPIGVLEFAGGSQFYIIHCALSSGLHMGMSVAIIIRMVSIRRKIKHVLGDTCTCPYVSVVAMTVESGLAYTIAMTLCSLPVSHTTGAAPVQIIVSTVLFHSASFLMNLLGNFGLLYRYSSSSWSCFDSICSPKNVHVADIRRRTTRSNVREFKDKFGEMKICTSLMKDFVDIHYPVPSRSNSGMRMSLFHSASERVLPQEGFY